MNKLCILVCPLDWGLGHASRCVPVIRAFLEAGCRVVVAASGSGAELIKKEFPTAGDLSPGFIPFPGFTVSYSGSFLFLKMMLQMPGFLFHIFREKRLLRGLVERYSPDLIVSDNRYGLVHGSVPSVLLTHQLRPALPFLLRFLEGPLSYFIRRLVLAFDECWVPDREDYPAAGRLVSGHEKLPAVFFTGWLSRFYPVAGNVTGTGSGYRGDPPFRYRMMFILSGVEPQRSILEKMIIDRLSGTRDEVLIVRGLPDIPFHRETRGAMEIVSYMDSACIREAAMVSELIICRCGYSSVMDLLALNKSAVLVPTPGQTEQEYLGKWLRQTGWFKVMKQRDFDPLLFAGAAPPLTRERGGLEGQFPAGTGKFPGRDDLLKLQVERVLQKLYIMKKDKASPPP
jgi:hypothetical protein